MDNNRGDFNARIRKKEGGVEAKEEWEKERDGGKKSKDTKINKEGKRLVEFIKEREWMVVK